MRGVLHTYLPLFVDQDGGVLREPAGPRALGNFLASVVAMGTRAAAGKRAGSVACRCRTATGACPGMIQAVVEAQPSRVEWRCPVCDDSGAITGWERTRWDRSVIPRRAKAPRSSSSKRTRSTKGRKAA